MKEYTEALGPSDDARPRDFSDLATESELTAWLTAIPASKPTLSIAFSLDATEIGVSYRVGEARSIPMGRVDELKTILENPAFPKSAADVKTVTRALLDRNINAAGFTDDPSLYAFLLDADPGGCSLGAMVERRTELKPGPRADERAHFTHELTERLRPEIVRRSETPPNTLPRSLRANRTPSRRPCSRAWNTRESA